MTNLYRYLDTITNTQKTVSRIPFLHISAAGSNTYLQYNANGVLGASSNLTWDGTSLNIIGDLSLGGSASIYGISQGNNQRIDFSGRNTRFYADDVVKGSSSLYLNIDGINQRVSINENNDDVDFVINSSNVGISAYYYNSGLDTHTWDAPVNKTLLTSSPDGAVSLAIATVGYADGVMGNLQKIISSATLKIKENFQATLHQEIDIQGELDIKGELVII